MLAVGNVLGRFSHRDVDVRVLFGVTGSESRILRIRQVGEAVGIARHALDADRKKGLAFARPDGMKRHPAGLQGRRAVPVHGCPRDIEPGQDADDAADVEALLARGQAAAAHQIVDRRSFELRHLLQHLVGDVGGKVIGSDVDERALVSAPNRGATVGDDDRVSHGARFSLRGRNCGFRWQGLQVNEVAELVLQPLLGTSQCAARVEPTAIFDVGPGGEMAAGRPGAKRLVLGIGRVEAHRLIRRAIRESLGERPRERTTIGLGLYQGHCGYHLLRLPHNMPPLMGRQPWRAQMRQRAQRRGAGWRSPIDRATIAASSPTPKSSEDLRLRRKCTPTKYRPGAARLAPSR